jgi:hypothetical protein
MSFAPRTWSYGRAFFLTLGLGVLGLMAVGWIAQGHKSDDWPLFAWILFGGMILAGFLICCFSIGSSNKAIKKLFDSSGTHEGEIVIAIIAAPVYWVGRFFEKPRRRR